MWGRNYESVLFEEKLPNVGLTFHMRKHISKDSWETVPLLVKGMVHPKIKIHSLSTHRYMSMEVVGEVSESTKHFWSFRVNTALQPNPVVVASDFNCIGFGRNAV